MAISEEETRLREGVRLALLTAIKSDAELASKSIDRGNFMSGESLRQLAEAYDLLTGDYDPEEEIR